MIARRYTCRPSQLLELSGWRALAVDIACSEAGAALEAAANPQPTTATRRPLRHQVG